MIFTTYCRVSVKGMRSIQSMGSTLRVARIAELLHPVGDSAAAGVIGGEREEIGAVIAVDQLLEMRLAELGVVGGIGQLVRVELDLIGLSHRLAVLGISCIRPLAPTGLLAAALNSLS